MRAKIIVLFINIFIMLNLVGCWDAMEIKNYSLVSLVGIDKLDNNIRLIMEVTSSSETQNGSGSKSEILVSEGSSFTEARNSYLRRSKKGLFLGSVRAVVFTDNYSKEGIEEYFDRIRGLREYNKIMYLFTTNTELEKLLENDKTDGTSIGYNLEHLSEDLIRKGMLNDTTMSVEMENALVKNAGYVLNNIDNVNGTTEINGYSIFKDNKKIGFIPESEMKGVNYFILKRPYSEYTIDFEDTKAALSALVTNKEIKAYYDGKNIDFIIRVFLHCEILGLSDMTKLNDEKLKELTNVISAVIKQDIEGTIKTSQEKYACDYLHLYKAFRERYNYDFKNMNWDEKYRQAKFNVEVRVDVKPANLINLE